MKRLLSAVVVAGFLFAGVVPSVEAAFLSGSTAYNLVNVQVVPTDDPYDDASTIISDFSIVGGSNTGDFTDGTIFSGSGVVLGTSADFTYNPKIVPISPFITFVGLNGDNAFTVTDFTLQLVSDPENSIVILTGTGYWVGDGYDLSLGSFTLSGTRIPSTSNPGTFSYAVSGTLNALGQPFDVVPEPTSMLLLGTGLLGLAARARRRKTE